MAAGYSTYFLQMFVFVRTKNRCVFLLLLFFYVSYLGCGYFSVDPLGGTQKYTMFYFYDK